MKAENSKPLAATTASKAEAAPAAEETTSSSGGSGGGGGNGAPGCSVTETEDKAGGRVLKVVVALPLLESMKGVDIDIVDDEAASSTALLLEAPKYERLQLNLREHVKSKGAKVDSENVRAKLSKGAKVDSENVR